MKLIRAEFLDRDCEECLIDLAKESKGEWPLAGKVVEISEHWLNDVCPHGRAGLKFRRLADLDGLPEAEQENPGGIDRSNQFDARMDATKDGGFPMREHGPYGSHSVHDSFSDESDPDSPGTY